MSVKIKEIICKPIQLGSNNSRCAYGYFKDFELSFSTLDSAKNLKELVSGMKLRINFGSLEIPDSENNWMYTTKNFEFVKMPHELKDEIITWYKNFLNFELVLENPEVDQWDYAHFKLSEEFTLSLNFSKNPNEDDPLNIWKEIDMRDLPGHEEKDALWQSYDRDPNNQYIGMEPKWNENHFYEGYYDEAKEEWIENSTNDIRNYVPGLTIDLSFSIQLEGEIENK